MGYQIMNLPMRKYKYGLFSIISDKTRDALIIDRQIVISKRNNRQRKIKTYTLYCHKCGSVFYRTENDLNNGKGCICNNCKAVIVGYNDLATMRPDLVPYIKDQELPYNIRPNSTKKIVFKCPECGYEHKAALNSFFNRSYSCPKCSDGISYPNKFMYKLFDQIGVEYIPEFSPKWAGKKRYDLYFIFDNKEYVVEADGGWHFKNNNLSNQTIKESQFKDLEKEQMLIEHDINIIRIDCRESNKDFIRKNILSSQLSLMFDLANIDWDSCDIFANKSILIEICKYYDNHNYPTRDELGKVFKLSKNTICSYLQTGRDLGICSYQDKDTKANQHFLDTIEYYNTHPNVSIREIADVIGVNRNMIADYLKRGTKMGLCKYTSKKESKEDKIRAIKYLLDKFPEITPTKIIALTGYPNTTVRRIYKELSNNGKQCA